MSESVGPYNGSETPAGDEMRAKGEHCEWREIAEQELERRNGKWRIDIDECLSAIGATVSRVNNALAARVAELERENESYKRALGEDLAKFAVALAEKQRDDAVRSAEAAERELASFAGSVLYEFGMSGDDLGNEEPGNAILRIVRKMKEELAKKNRQSSSEAEVWSAIRSRRALGGGDWK